LIVNEALEDETKEILDPSSGSGTFLAASIRRKKELMSKNKKYSASAQLDLIMRTVRGIDVHPLAIILSRANYLAAIGPELLSARRGAISVPVYLANSLRLPETATDLHQGVSSYKIDAEKKILRLPIQIAKDPDFTDIAIETVREYSHEVASGLSPKIEEFENLLYQRLTAQQKNKLEKNAPSILLETAITMADLIKEGKDTIWAFILKNIYKPLFLQAEKFDVIVGNPPWLSYRYVESTEYQDFLKNLIIDKYNILGKERAELITQMELATLFLARASDLFLKKQGTIYFVMPRSVFVSDQHFNFRDGSSKPSMKLFQLYDLEDVEPLFKVPSCVVAAKFGTPAKQVDAKIFEGKLQRKNAKLKEALAVLTSTDKKFQCYRIGQRSFLESVEFQKVLRAIEKSKPSEYYKNFTQGATIVPRQLWFVEPVVHEKLGMDPSMPRLKTSQRAIDRAKEQYADVRVEGEVESRFLFGVATGSELAPFCSTTLPVVVLPIEASEGKYHMLDVEESQRKGYSGLKEWLVTAEKTWKKKRGEKATKMSIYQRLNYSHCLTNQSSKKKYKVLYNASGTYLVSCIVRNQKEVVELENSRINITGVVADAKAYWFDTNNLDEALFITSMLNSPIVDSLIKPMQSHGLWGERDIHKKVLELPLPKFDSSNKSHIAMVELAKKAQVKAETLIPSLEKKYVGIGKIRQLIKVELAEELLNIDKIMRELLSKIGDLDSGMEGFLK